MKTYTNPLDNQHGFILVLGMAMLVVLTLIGLSATRSSVIDIKIAGNERTMVQEFYVVDSTWRIGALWLNQQATAPDIVNRNSIDASTDFDDDYYKIVRNYGNGGSDITNNAFNDGTQDGTYMNTSFWYRILMHDGSKPEGFGEDYEDFPIDINTNASRRTSIATRMFKALRTGY